MKISKKRLEEIILTELKAFTESEKVDLNEISFIPGTKSWWQKKHANIDSDGQFKTPEEFRNFVMDYATAHPSYITDSLPNVADIVKRLEGNNLNLRDMQTWVAAGRGGDASMGGEEEVEAIPEEEPIELGDKDAIGSERMTPPPLPDDTTEPEPEPEPEPESYELAVIPVEDAFIKTRDTLINAVLYVLEQLWEHPDIEIGNTKGFTAGDDKQLEDVVTRWLDGLARLTDMSPQPQDVENRAAMHSSIPRGLTETKKKKVAQNLAKKFVKELTKRLIK